MTRDPAGWPVVSLWGAMWGDPKSTKTDILSKTRVSKSIMTFLGQKSPVCGTILKPISGFVIFCRIKEIFAKFLWNIPTDSELCGKSKCVGGEESVVVPEFSSVDVNLQTTDDGKVCKYLDWTKSHTAASGNQFYNSDRVPAGTPCGDEKVCVPAAGGIRGSECKEL